MAGSSKRSKMATGDDVEIQIDDGNDRQQRRIIRSKYLHIRNLITDKSDDISGVDSEKFASVIDQVENLHNLVQKPREQVADAETLLEIASTLATSVRAQVNEGLTPSDFVAALLRNFGNGENAHDRFKWVDLGLATSKIFKKVPGCCTIIGPMNTELKPRKVPAVRKKQTRPTESTCPEELADSGIAMKTDTDKNMSTMFDILRRKRSARLENLVLNRESFAQTVENIFALSFLIKDGRAAITVNDNGHHIVAPRNAPAADTIANGEVSYSHFVFRFDFKDWKLMKEIATVGDELMPHRTRPSTSGTSKNDCAESAVLQTDSGAPTTPIRKLTRNRGLVIQDEPIINASAEKGSSIGNRKGKRLWGK